MKRTAKQKALEAAITQYRTEYRKKAERLGWLHIMPDEKDDRESAYRIVAAYVSRIPADENLS